MEAFENMRGIEKVINSHRQHYATKFTHGDFAPRNIMSLIGIALAGFLSTGNTQRRCLHPTPDDWVESIGEMTGRYDEQLAGERQLYEVCGHELT